MKRTALGMAVVVFGSVLGVLHAQEAEPAEESLRIFPLQAASAEDMAALLLRLLPDDEGLTVNFDARTNRLIVRANAETLARVEDFLRVMDEPVPEQPPPRRRVGSAIVSIEVTIAEMRGNGEPSGLDLSASPDQLATSVRALEEQGGLAVLQRFRLSTLDGQKASVQVGESVATTRGSTMGPGGRGGFGRSTVYEMQNLGSIVMVTPRVEDGGTILLEATVERTRLAQAPHQPRAEDGEDPEAVPQGTTTLSLASTLRLADGGTAVLGASDSADEAGAMKIITLVSARVVEPSRGAE